MGEGSCSRPAVDKSGRTGRVKADIAGQINTSDDSLEDAKDAKDAEWNAAAERRASRIGSGGNGKKTDPGLSSFCLISSIRGGPVKTGNGLISRRAIVSRYSTVYAVPTIRTVVSMYTADVTLRRKDVGASRIFLR